MSRGRKEENFTGSRFSCAITFRTGKKCINYDLRQIKCVNEKFATKILSRRFPDCPKGFHCFQIVLTVSRLAGEFQDCLDSFRIVRTVSGLSGQFPDCPDSFQTVRTVSRLSGQFPDYSDSFQTVQTVSRL